MIRINQKIKASGKLIRKDLSTRAKVFDPLSNAVGKINPDRL